MKHDKHAFITTQHRKCIAHRISGAAVETTIASDKKLRKKSEKTLEVDANCVGEFGRNENWYVLYKCHF
jgi:hypothetical protein